MDILVTVPKKEAENIRKEDAWIKEQGSSKVTQFWSMKRLPKSLEKGDRVYFVQDGAVRYYHDVLDISRSPSQECQVTGRTWTGPAIILKCPEVTLKTPIPQKGFQGFRYIPRRWFE